MVGTSQWQINPAKAPKGLSIIYGVPGSILYLIEQEGTGKVILKHFNYDAYLHQNKYSKAETTLVGSGKQMLRG